jgi:hypothetical protein
MRSTTNPLSATGSWIASSATICPSYSRRNDFYHRGAVVNHDEFRRNSNLSPVGVSQDHSLKLSKIRPGPWQCRKRSTRSKKIAPGS